MSEIELEKFGKDHAFYMLKAKAEILGIHIQAVQDDLGKITILIGNCIKLENHYYFFGFWNKYKLYTDVVAKIEINGNKITYTVLNAEKSNSKLMEFKNYIVGTHLFKNSEPWILTTTVLPETENLGTFYL